MIIKKSHKLGFGKHKGKTIEEILVSDPTYIRWAIRNIPEFEMSEKDTKEAITISRMVDLERDDYYGTIDIYDYCD